MRFYTDQHRHYAGVDLHARTGCTGYWCSECGRATRLVLVRSRAACGADPVSPASRAGRERPKKPQECFWLRRSLPMKDYIPGGIEYARVHRPCIEVDTGVVPVLIGVESHGGLLCQGLFRYPSAYRVGRLRRGPQISIQALELPALPTLCQTSTFSGGAAAQRQYRSAFKNVWRRPSDREGEWWR